MNVFELIFSGSAVAEDGTVHYFRFLDQWETGVTALVLLAIASVTIYCYRKEPQRMPVWAKTAAVLLRWAAAVSFILILWRPAVTFEKVLREKPYIIFIADKSLSMGIPDVGTDAKPLTRDGQVTALLEKIRNLKGLDRFNTAVFTVGENVRESSFDDLEQYTPEEKFSKMYEETLDILGRFRGRTIAGVYLFTDGNVNGGLVNASAFNVSLVQDFSGIPFYIAGVGSREALEDGLLSGIVVPENVFVNESIEIICKYEIQGTVPASVSCVLIENGTEVEEKTVEAQQKGEVVFTYKPAKPGNSLLTCRLKPVGSEKHLKNNELTRIIRVYEGKLKILYVEGTPRWEFRYLKNALLRDKMAEISTLLLSADSGFVQEGEIPINEFPDTKALEKYDVIIIGNVDASFFTETQMSDIAECVEKKGTGIVFIPGSMEIAASFIHTPLEDLMPVKILPTERYTVFRERTVFQPFRPEISEGGWEHPVLQLTDSLEETKELWGLLPPLYKFMKTGGIKPGKTVIAVHPGTTAIHEPDVVFAGGFYGVGKSFFSAVDSTWRWRFQSGDTYFYRFWLNVFRYVSSGRFSGGREPCLVLTGKQTFDIGEEIPLKVLIRDRNFRPVVSDTYRVTVVGPDDTKKEIELEASPGRDGYFGGTLYPRKSGMYTLFMDNPEGVSKEYRKLNVVLPKGEFRQMLLNTKGLKDALKGTDGTVFSVSDEAPILNHIAHLRDETREEIIKTDIEVFNHPLLFFVILFGLTGEWVLRKMYRLN